MSKTIKTFGYSITKMKKSDRPFDPIVHIELEQWSPSKNGIIAISSQLMHEDEIDYHIKALQDDLTAVGNRAKAALKRAKTTTKEIVANRNSS